MGTGTRFSFSMPAAMQDASQAMNTHLSGERVISGKTTAVSVSRDLSCKMANMGFCCAVLVVFIHVGIPTPTGTVPWFFIELFRDVFGDIAVPYFFLASGFFLAGHMDEPGWYLREMKKRFRTLLIPYVLWSLLFAVYLMPVTIVCNLHAHRSWRWNLGFPDWVITFGLDFLQNPLLFWT